MEPAVFSANSGAFWKTATRAVLGTDANLSRSDEIKNRENREIVKHRKSSRSGGRTEGRRLQELSAGALELMFLDFKPSDPFIGYALFFVVCSSSNFLDL